MKKGCAVVEVEKISAIFISDRRNQTLSDFSVSVNGHFLFHIDQLNIESGDKIGLVGANASGKSTFLKSIVNEAAPSSQAFFRNGLWSYFEQAGSGLPEVHDLEQISRWGLQDLTWRYNQDFSGGEAVRMRLAHAFSEPHDILVLDEPTAHLDGEGLKELRRQLARENTCILVSHDRSLLNEFCRRTLVIQEGELRDFPGTYDEWKISDEEKQVNKSREYENAKQEKARLLSVVQDQKQRAAKTQRKPRKLSRSEAKARDFATVGKSIGGKAKSLSAAAKNTEKRIERLSLDNLNNFCLNILF